MRSLLLAIVSVVCLAAPLLAADGGLQHPYPLWPSEPVPGWPGVGVSPEFAAEKLAAYDQQGNLQWPATYGQPEFLAYPGAVHHDRNEWQRYVASYPIYNHLTLRRNFILGEMKQYAAMCEEWAEPVYYNPMYGHRMRTPKSRPAVKVLRMKPGMTIAMEIGKLKPSLYCLRPIYAAPGVSNPVEKKYVLFRFRVNDDKADPAKMNTYFLRAQTLDNFYAGQEFFFHAEDNRAYRAELTLVPGSEVELVVHNVDVHDRFGDCAYRDAKKGKTRSVLSDTSERKARWEKLRNDAEFRAKELVDAAEQKKRDDAAWAAGWPMNVHVMAENAKNFMVPAPDDWERYDWTLRCLDGKFYGSRVAGRWGREIYNRPATYTYTGGKVVLKLLKDGKIVSEDLGDPQPGMWYDAMKSNLMKDKALLRGGLRDAVVADATLLENGKQIGPAPREMSLRWFRPGETYFDKGGMFRQTEVIEMGDAAKGKLFYNASHMRGLPNGRDLDRVAQGKTRSQHERDWVMTFIEGVYRWPSIQPKHNLDYLFAGAVSGAASRPHALDREWNRRYGWGVRGQMLIEGYDAAFPIIDGNEELAQAVGRHIPWIKTSADLRKMLDAYVIQDNANDIRHHRYYYDHSMHLLMMKAVVAQDDPKISTPWMEFLWTRVWEYPQALSGTADNVVTGSTREGSTTIGSFNYTRVPRHFQLVGDINTYMESGGDKKYDITDPSRYRQVYISPYFLLDAAAVGRHAPGIGDVGGSTQAYGGRLDASTAPLFEYGWRWHKDPDFAYELVNTFSRNKEWTDAEWAEITKAAEGARDPYLARKSRVLADWDGYLKAGQSEDDFRFQRGLAVRVGNGWGHNHWDTLDLRLWNHGIVMSGDAGQRSSYGVPKHRETRVHNTMEVDGKNWYSHSWVGHLFDAPDAKYMRAESPAPHTHEGVGPIRRQVALMTVDEGKRSTAEEPRKDPNVVTPDTYVFDVLRGSGGKTYTYCFHGACDDQFTAGVKNRVDMKGPKPEGETNLDELYLAGFVYREAVENPSPEDVEWAADCDGDVLQATWRVGRYADHEDNPEKKMYSPTYKHGGAMTAERKFTRLHLLEAMDARVLHGICQDRNLWSEHNIGKPNYAVRCLFAQRRNEEPTDNVFVALLEMYGGDPQITGRRLLPIADNEMDRDRAVAVEVKTANGHIDMLYADARPEKTRVVDGAVTVSGEYATISRDTDGLRLATLTNGATLRADDVRIDVAVPRYGGRILDVDYLKRRVTVVGRVPERLAGQVFEVGNDAHRTSYEVAAVERGPMRSVLVLRKGMEIMRTRVRDIDPEKNQLRGAVAMTRLSGRDRGLVASDDQLKKFWRVAYVGGNRHEGHLFELSPLDMKAKADGPVFTAKDFPAGSGISVWEFGKGDEMILRTGASLRRIAPDIYELYATAPCTVALKGKSLSISADGKTWKPLKARAQDGLLAANIAENQLAGGTLQIRATR